MSQVLGIDIGSYSIKFAVLEIAKINVILKQVIEIPIPVRTNPEEEKLAKIQALRQMFETHTALFSSKDNIYVGLGSQHTVLQNFEFLKVSTRNLPKIVENEFDELGLFAQNEYIVDMRILHKHAKQIQVLGMLIQKSAVRDLIEILTTANVMCRIIDLESLAFQNIIPYTSQIVPTDPQQHESGQLIVNVGHNKTSLCIIENDKLVLEYSFNLAGKYITSKIQKDCGISWENAEDLKHKISQNIVTNSEHAENIKMILADAYTEIGKEVARFILSLTRSTQARHIDSVLLTGGSSKYFDCVPIFEKLFNIRTVRLNLADERFTNSTGDLGVFESFSQAIALGLRGTAAKINSDLNVRHGEFALISDYENLIENIIYYTRITAIILICLIATYGLRSYLYNKKINQIKNLFSAQITEYFGSEPNELKLISLNPNWDLNKYSTESFKLIQSTYQQRVRFIKDLYSNDVIMPLILLNNISTTIPKTLYFEVSNYKYQDGILNIVADTDSKDSINKIIQLLSSIKDIKNVQKKSEMEKPGTNGQLMTFSIIATIQTQE